MKTLVVSENNTEVELLRRILKNNFRNLEFINASDEKEIENIILTDGPFGFFIMDADIKSCDPDLLSKSILDIAGEKPFLFIGNSASITDRITQELYQSNTYNDQIYKPFDRTDFADDIKNKVGSILDWAKQEEFEASIEQINPEDFIKMRLRGFYQMNSFPYDMFLEITSTEYIKIISANKPYSISTLDIYAKKNIKFLYIKKDDHLEYLETEALKCVKLLKKYNASSDDYYIILLRSITIAQQYILSLGITSNTEELLDEISEGMIKIEGHYSKIQVALKQFPQFYQGVASKSLLTGIISISIAKKMGWESKTTKLKLAICSVLQDYALPDESMTKINYPNDSRLNDYTDEEIEQFFDHPNQAAIIGRQLTKYPDIEHILESHQELPMRKGFPNQLTQSKLTAISCVFIVAQFASAEFDGRKYSKEMLTSVIKLMNRDFNQGNFKVPFEFLKESL